MSVIGDLFSGIEKLLLGKIAGAIIDELGSKGPDKDIQPGDVEIHSITLMSQDQQKKYSLLAQCVGFEIYESILCPTVCAELTIADSIDLLQSFPIVGEEYVLISFRTPKTKGNPATYLFQVKKVYGKTVSENNKRVSYKLQLVTPEWYRNATQFAPRKLVGEGGELVINLMKDVIRTEKPVTVDCKTRHHDRSIKRMEPFRAIHYLCETSTSAEYLSSSYLFFENRKGYHFTTLEKMLEDGSKLHKYGLTDKEFFFDAARKESVTNVTLRNILAYNQPLFNDAGDKAQGGGIKNQAAALDLVTWNIKKVNYDDSGSDVFKSADSSTTIGQNSANFRRVHGQSTTNTKYIPVNSEQPVTPLIAEKLTLLQGFMQKLMISNILIYGDSEIVAGDTIKCSFPSASAADNDRGVSRLDSGNYLISGLRHIITNGDRPGHTMALELVKTGFTEVA
jgi:hypothetical protein